MELLSICAHRKKRGKKWNCRVAGLILLHPAQTKVVYVYGLRNAKKMNVTPSELIRERILETIVKDFELWDIERLEAEMKILKGEKMKLENKIRWDRGRKAVLAKDKDGQIIRPAKLLDRAPTESELAEADALEKQLLEEIVPKLSELTQHLDSLKKNRDSVQVLL